MEELNDKVAVVTGAAGGIGLGLARQLAAAGSRLSLADIDADGLERARSNLRVDGAEVMTTVTDVGVLDDVAALAEETVARFGGVDVVVNNAGVIAWNPIDALTIGDWRWVMDVNFWGVLHGVHVFLPIMERQGTEGHFVNVSSIGGVFADTPFMATYSATKAAVIGLSLTLAAELELQQRPISVTIVCPGGTRDTSAHLAERNRPTTLGPVDRRPEAQALFDIVDAHVREGQPVEAVAQRVVEAIRRDELWAFPHPDSAALVEPRLQQLAGLLRVAAAQPTPD